MSRGGGREPGRGLRAGILVTALLTMSSSPVTGDCLKHITVTGGPLVTGEAGNLTVRLVLQEVEEVEEEGRLLYRVTWDETLAPPRPARQDFVRFFQVDDSVPRQWTVSLREPLLGVPDYPSLKNEITEVVVFPAFSDGCVCSLALSHLIQDANTKTPVMEASSWFLRVARDFPTHTPLPGLTVTVMDNDATTPNNLMEVSVERGCPLASGRDQYGGTAGRGDPVLFHLTSPMGHQVNHTITCTLTVKDLGRPSRSAVATLTLSVEDAPRDPPFAFAFPFYRAKVSPGTEVGAPLTMSPAPVQVRDRSLAAPPRVTYSLRDAWPGVVSAAEYFTIDTLTVEVRVARALSGLEGAGSVVLPLVLTAHESSGEVNTAILEVILDHSLPPLPLPFSPREPSLLASSPLPPSPASCPCLATQTSRRRARVSLSFSRMSYAAEVFLTDTFVGRVEARLRGLRGKVHYSWARGNEDSKFVLNSTSGVITVPAAGARPGHHLLTVQATAGRLSAKAQVSVRVVAGGDAGFSGGGVSRACTRRELLGLQVAVGVLAALLALLLLALGIAGAVLYRRRKAREQTEVKHISTLGSAYPNLSFSRESQE